MLEDAMTILSFRPLVNFKMLEQILKTMYVIEYKNFYVGIYKPGLT